jgi:hypothetical protein
LIRQQHHKFRGLYPFFEGRIVPLQSHVTPVAHGGNPLFCALAPLCRETLVEQWLPYTLFIISPCLLKLLLKSALVNVCDVNTKVSLFNFPALGAIAYILSQSSHHTLRISALLNKGMNEADAETARRGDAVIIFDANSKIIPQLCNARISYTRICKTLANAQDNENICKIRL